ncbi:hypothetical protein ILUMI_22589 [Ignelater luminosus]|uniref:Acid phosphatase n=1 Tax=Ignelater luminosus TaxID=2038154 RepID=A0A8K0CCI4_IGNLU|nr:hypothetical protein ILUMI_22589 [Ignelater luminosus]
MKIYYFTILCVLILKEQHVATDTLKLVHVLFRHGDRTPTQTYTNDPHKYWPEGWGQLTNKGKQEMYNFGLMLRETYKTFLSEYYSPNDLLVMSSYADRNLMSAQMVLAGLYPPVKEQIWNPDLLWQPIPVKYLPRSLDNIIAQKRKCQLYDAAIEAAYKSEDVQKIDKENQDLYRYLTENTGEEVNNIAKVETLYNTFNIEMIHNLSLPKWIDNLSMDNLRTIAAKHLALFSDTTFMKRLKGGPFLKQVISRMSQKSQNNLKPDLRLILYSGHDLTIVTVMRTLGFGELLKPDYAASLIFELHQMNNNYEVKLLYKANITETSQLELKFCPSPCLLSDFINGLDMVLPVDWEEECVNGVNKTLN